MCLSTGHGRLHLIEAACALRESGSNVQLLTGWIPNARTPNWLLNGLAPLVGRRELASGLRKRNPDRIPRSEITSMPVPEIATQALLQLVRLRILTRDDATSTGWWLYGRASCRNVRDVDILHVRSGAARGGLVAHCRRLGIKILADHSAAHPKFTQKSVAHVYQSFGRSPRISPNTTFWRNVIADCEEADGVLVNSEFVKETFVEQGMSPAKIHVARLGIPPEFIGVKSSYNLNDPIKLLFTGNFDLLKGAHLIIDAIVHLQKYGLSARLDVIGNAHPDLSRLARDRCGDDVVFHGRIPREDLPRHLREADVYVFPSYAEGAAQSAIEAMGAGVPTIATRESGAPIRHLHNGLQIPRDDSASLAESVALLAKDQLLRKRLGENGIETVRAKQSWTHYATQVRQVYTNLCGP